MRNKISPGALMLVVLALMVAACAPAATPTTTPMPTATPAAQATPGPAAKPPATAVATASPTPRPSPTSTTVSAGPKYGGVLVIPNRGDPPFFDPYVSSLSNIHRPLNFVHARLARFDAEKKPCMLYPLDPELAESWKWLDDITFQVKVRPGVRFQNLPPVNGREVVADDVAYTLGTQLPRFSFLAEVSLPIKKLEVVDKFTINIGLKSPNAPLGLRLVSDELLPIVPREAFAATQELPPGIDRVIGAGPFKMSKYVPSVKVDLVKNPDYWRKGLPYLDGVSAVVMPETSTVAAALRSGKLDMAWELTNPASVMDLEKTAPWLNSLSCPESSSNILGMRTDQKPFDDLRVRRAVAMAIDRDAMFRVAYVGEKYGSKVWGPVSPVETQYFLRLEDYPPETRQYLTYNPEKAKALLAEAGYPAGFETDVWYTQTGYGPLYPMLAEIASAELAKVGIRLKLNPMVHAEYSFVLNSEAGWKGMALFKYPSTPLDKALYGRLHSSIPGSSNRFRVKDAELDKLIELYQTTGDENRLKQTLRDLQIRAADQALGVWTGLSNRTYFGQPYVKGGTFVGALSNSISDYLIAAWKDK